MERVCGKKKLNKKPKLAGVWLRMTTNQGNIEPFSTKGQTEALPAALTPIKQLCSKVALRFG